jgi:hypothetical protein
MTEPTSMTGDDREVRFVAPAAVLGGGFSRKSLHTAMASRPHFLACDAGSTDWGPYYLGSGTSWAGYRQTRRDLQLLIAAAAEAHVPLLIGSAGFTGSESGLAWFRGIVTDIIRDLGLSLNVAAFHSEVSKEWVNDKVRTGKVTALDGRPDLTVETVDGTARIAAMMGPEPYATALDAGADIILSARSSDAALYAAVPLARGVPDAEAWHMGKITECGYAIADPISAGECIVGAVGREGFAVRPTGPRSRCTVASVASQMLYENASPHLLREPPGVLLTADAKYSQLDESTVLVAGASFRPEPYSVRLEGVTQVGHRSICLFGVRDPAIIAQMDTFTDDVVELVRSTAEQRYGLGPDDFTFRFRRYGYDAVLGDLEPMAARNHEGCYEVGLVAEAVCADQELAHEVVSGSMPFFMHGVRVPGVKHSANGALAYAPNVLDTGAVFEWTVWHAALLDRPDEPFPMDLELVGATAGSTV